MLTSYGFSYVMLCYVMLWYVMLKALKLLDITILLYDSAQPAFLLIMSFTLLIFH